jgi:hypothetical protein
MMLDGLKMGLDDAVAKGVIGSSVFELDVRDDQGQPALAACVSSMAVPSLAGDLPPKFVVGATLPLTRTNS